MWNSLASSPVWLAIAGAAALLLIAAVGWLVQRGRSRQPHGLDLLHKEPAAEPEAFVSVAELEREYAQRGKALRRRQEDVDKRMQELQERQYESTDLEALLETAGQDERSNLAAILKLPLDSSSRQLTKSLRRAGSHLVGTLFRRGDGVAYSEVVRDAGSKLKVPAAASASTIYDQERAVMTAAFANVLAQASPEQRQAIVADLEKANQGSAVGLGASAATLVAANLSGFALYTAASTTLAAVSGAVGVTLPFATYMGLSSFLATATGPVGWSALGLWAVFQFGGANYKMTVPAVLLIGTVRTRLIAERDQELEALEHERSLLEQDLTALEKLKTFLESVGSLGKEHRVRLADVPR